MPAPLLNIPGDLFVSLTLVCCFGAIKTKTQKKKNLNVAIAVIISACNVSYNITCKPS